MKKIILIISALAFHTVLNAQELKTEKDSLSYALGVSIGTKLKTDKIDINSETFGKAVKAVIEDKSLMTTEESQNFINHYFMNLSMKQANENKAKGQAFLDKNKTQTGVVTLPSGLQYNVIKEGAGEKPTVNDRVKVHYAGTTIDGNEFDSSIKRGEPTTFGLTQVIKGWTEILQLMPVGSKWKVVIPENLAYGQQGPPAIGPNQTLVFEIELLEIVK
jgi:FKBP-type peptidyl-prolyl cis-trans isomerase FklB